MLLTLRRIADLIIVGAGTVRAEGYGAAEEAGPADRRRQPQRQRRPVDLPLFASGAGFLIVPEDAPGTPIETVRAGDGEVDLAAALQRLPGDPRFVQAEGGPSLNGALAAADLVDEINLTTSPLVVGGDRLAGDRRTRPELDRRFAWPTCSRTTASSSAGYPRAARADVECGLQLLQQLQLSTKSPASSKFL